MLDSFRRKKHIAADITDLGGDMLDYNDAIILVNGTYNFFLLVFTWAICDTTSHLDLLSVGPIHLGGTGTYAVIITNRGKDVYPYAGK
jgi:hypothetical protein